MPDNPEEKKEQQQRKKLLAGKYETPEALEQGYNNLFTEGQRLLAKARALEEQNRILQAVAEARGDSGTDEESDPGAMDARVTSKVMEILGPLLTGAEKVALLGSDQGDIGTFLQANPEIQATFQGISDAHAAAEYARAMYKLNQNAEGDKRVDQSSAAARAAVEASMGAAEVPGSRSISRTPADPNQEHSDRLKAALERAEKTGDATEYARERLLGGPGGLDIWYPGEPVPPSLLPKGN
jgi:hypothetical protein